MFPVLAVMTRGSTSSRCPSRQVTTALGSVLAAAAAVARVQRAERAISAPCSALSIRTSYS